MEYEAETFLLDLYLPNNTILQGIRASAGDPGGCDLLIGMDVIGHGDLSITNCNHRTCFSYRAPSVAEIDFVEEVQEFKRQYGGWNPQGMPNRHQRRSNKKKKR